MDLHQEQLIRELRRELAFEGFPGAVGTFVLADWLKEKGHVRIVYAEVEAASISFPWDEPAEITLPAAASIDEIERQLLHELMHFIVFRHSGAWFCRERCPAGWKRLVVLDMDRDEAAVRRAVLAWRIPADMLARYYDQEEELMEQSGCSREEVRERLRQFFGADG